MDANACRQLLLCAEFKMTSILTRSSGATIVRLTTALHAPHARCLMGSLISRKRSRTAHAHTTTARCMSCTLPWTEAHGGACRCLHLLTACANCTAFGGMRCMQPWAWSSCSRERCRHSALDTFMQQGGTLPGRTRQTACCGPIHADTPVRAGCVLSFDVPGLHQHNLRLCKRGSRPNDRLQAHD